MPEEKQQVTQPGPDGLDPADVKRQEQIRRDDLKKIENEEDGVLVRAPRKGEGGAGFGYGEPNPESDYAKEDVVFDPDKPGGESFGYGRKK